MVNANDIKPDAVVVCSKNNRFAIVDHMEGADSIKLKKDNTGRHHFIPLSWVKKIDDKVHLSRSGEQARKEWTMAPIGKPLVYMPVKNAPNMAEDRATNEGMKPAPKAKGVAEIV